MYSCPVIPFTRSQELRIIRSGGTIRVSLIAYFMGFGKTLVMSLIFVAFTSSGGTLTPRAVFTTLSLVLILRRIAMAFLIRSIFHLSEGSVAIRRIKVVEWFYSKVLIVYDM